MSTIHNGRITTTYNYNKVREIPEYNLPALHRTHSLGAASVTSSSASTTPRESRRCIKRSEGCFITKQFSYGLEIAHWVSAVRKDRKVKAEVELFLRILGLVGPDFSLNSPSNLTPLNLNLSYTFDKLGFFAITCSMATLEAIAQLIDDQNSQWQAAAERDQCYIRSFNRQEPPFSTAEYEMVVLHPFHFLPNGTGFYVSGPSGHKFYQIGHGDILREAPGDASSQPFPAFAFDASRSPKEKLNPFLVILNAEMCFRRFKRSPHQLDPGYEELIALTTTLVEKIYFKPLVATMKELMPVTHAREDDEENIEKYRGTGEVRSNTKAKDIGRTVDRSSRTGGGPIKNPGPEASHDQVIEYMQYIMSGRDNDIDSDDEELLAELGV